MRSASFRCRHRFRPLFPIAAALLLALVASAGHAAPDSPDRPGHVRRKVPAHHPERLLVRFVPGTPASIRSDARARVAGRLDRAFSLVDGLERIAVPSGTVPRAIDALRGNPNILYAEHDRLVRLFAAPSDPRFNELWGLQNVGQTLLGGDAGTPGADINVVPAWEKWAGDPGFRVAIIDTGVNYLHPDLAANIWSNPGEIPDNGLDDDGNGYVDDIHGYDFLNGDSDPMDDHRHGSHVAGTICAAGDNGVGVTGINWRCSIVALKFLDSSGSGHASDAILALEYAVTNRILISNNSWGLEGEYQPLDDAISAARIVGHLFVAAAGNSSEDIDTHPVSPGGSTEPNVLSVAATDHHDNRAFFSNYGLQSVDLGAPGTAILSTVLGTDYDFFQGTSMAAPHVTGAAALIWSRYPSLTWKQVRNRILQAVDPVSDLQGLTVTGGRLNVTAALSDCNANGIPDDQEIATGASDDCGSNGIPDECESDCDGNGWADTCDLHLGRSLDCDGDSILDQCEPDCDGDGVPDECAIAAGTVPDCNRNAVPDSCDVILGGLDCNGNGRPDTCDVADGSSPDCNENRIPDECLVLEGDCNLNSVPDECDLDAQPSSDCDQNKVLDECETSPDCDGNGVADYVDLCRATLPDCNQNGVPDGCDVASGTSADCNVNGLPDECEFGMTIGYFDHFSPAFPGLGDPFVDGLRQSGHVVVRASFPPFPPYDAILVSGDRDVSSIAADLDSYVNGGGVLVFLGTDAPLPAMQSLPVASRQGGWRVRQNARVVHPADPIAAGLAAQAPLQGLSNTIRLVDTARPVVVWEDGTPMLAVSRYGSGRSVYLNNAGAWMGSMGWHGAPAFGRRLMNNLLAHIAPGSGDCNGNFTLDVCEIRDGTVADAFPSGGDGIPDACQSDCDVNGVPDETELNGRDCDDDGVLDDCQALIRDCDGNGIPDSCDIASSAASDCDDNGIIDACEPDCDVDGIADRCEIVSGTAGDCDLDGLQDACETDADADLVPDECGARPDILLVGSVNAVTQQTVRDKADSLTWIPSIFVPDDLAPFDVILLGQDGVPSDSAVQSRMDQFVADGGGLVLFQGQVSFHPQFIQPSNPVIGAGSTQFAWPDGTRVLQSESPVVAGLPVQSRLYGRVSAAILRDEASEIASWPSLDIPAIAAMTYGNGRTVWINDLYADLGIPAWQGDPDFGVELLRNAIDFASGRSGICDPPTETVSFASVIQGPGSDTTFTLADSNAAGSVTGYNFYRASGASLGPAGWIRIEEGVQDADLATPGVQWRDPSNDPLSGEAWFYLAAAFNAVCPAEGPR